MTQATPSTPQGSTPPANTIAFAGFVLGLLAMMAGVLASGSGIFAYAPAALFGVLAVIFGIIGIVRARRLGGTRMNNAIWAVVLGVVGAPAGSIIAGLIFKV
ncbi:MAG: hypothetical protein JWO10_1136 [Microbacteriaceae bacterium]|jgi:uncharacterized membrane protein|nr:hypothetical protein [Microbacteriaceae bacterium]